MSKQAHTLLFWFVVFVIALALSAGVQQALAIQTETKITPATPIPDHTFGYSVDIYGTTAVVGTPNGGLEGVYIYEYDGTTWVEEQQIVYSTTVEFGFAVAVSKDTLFVGAIGEQVFGFDNAGAVYVYKKDQSTGIWSLVNWLEEPVPGESHFLGSQWT